MTELLNHINYKNDENTTRIQIAEGVPFVTFPKLSEHEQNVVHGFSTRLGGVSQAHLSSMNLSFTRGDDRENVLENHRRFAKAIGYDEKRLVFSNQVHLTNFYKVTEDDIGKGIVRDSDILEIDGLVTNVPEVPLITFYADCVPLFFYDPVCRVIAMAHSGWKGTVERIGAKMIDYMEQEYGCKASDIICSIAPSICQTCYEVSEDVIVRFQESFSEQHWDALYYEKENGKYQLNLQKACEITLLESGVQKCNLDITDLCTCCNPNVFYSHRASHGMRGNLAGVMMLKKVGN